MSSFPTYGVGYPTETNHVHVYLPERKTSTNLPPTSPNFPRRMLEICRWALGTGRTLCSLSSLSMNSNSKAVQHSRVCKQTGCWGHVCTQNSALEDTTDASTPIKELCLKSFIKIFYMGQAFGLWVKKSVRMPLSCFRMPWFSSWFHLPCWSCLWEEVVMAQVIGFVPLTSEIWLSSWLPASALSPSIGGGELVSLSFSAYQIYMYIHSKVLAGF